ncbi:MAG: STM3941 family protein [Phycisphaerae bacterium]|jgi:hypothetical protein
MECRTDRSKQLALLLGASLLLAACYVCVFVNRKYVPIVVGWFGFVFFGYVLLRILFNLLRPTTMVIVNDEGIEDRRWGIGVIPWHDITAISLRRIRSSIFLCVEVSDPSEYISRMSALRRFSVWANGLLDFPPITVSFSGLSPSIHEAWDYISAHCRLLADEDCGP